MKIILGLFLCLSFVVNSFGSPLIFKTSKTLEWGKLEEIATVETGKFKQIRISVSSDDGKYIDQISVLGIENDGLFTLASSDFRLSYSTVIDSPPTKIKISVKGQGNFNLYVYGSQ